MSSVILREIAELSNPAPRDFDPEGIAPDFDSSGSDNGEDSDAGREHYVNVSKSKLKSNGNDTLLKDPKYRGKTASRKDVFEEASDMEDGDSNLEDSVEEEDEEQSSSQDEDEMEDESAEESVNAVNGFEETDGSSEMSESGEEDDDDNDVDDDDDEETDQDDRREKVRQLLAQENKSVAKQLAESANEDAQKGRDIKIQQRFYDTLLDALIRFQKVLLSLNSLPQGTSGEKFTDEDTEAALQLAKQEALNMFSLTLDLRTQLTPHIQSTGVPSRKRKFAETSLSELIEISNTYNQQFMPWRDEVLTKWSDKVKAASGLPMNQKFKALSQSITSQLAEHLSASSRPKLIQRTQTKRSTFSILGKNQLYDERKEIIDPDIFDDLDFYHPLLKELVERKALDIRLPSEHWNKKPRGRKTQEETRASKGRKLRYQEHEKLMNFMAPIEVGTWHEDQIDDLFASLLGRRIQIDEEDVQQQTEPTIDLSDGMRIFG